MAIKQLVAASIVLLSGLAQAYIQDPDPQVADLRIEIKKGDAVVVSGTALVSLRKPLEFNSVKEHRMQTTGCENTPITGPMTYRDGAAFGVGGITRHGTMYASLGFAYHVPEKGTPSPSNGGCVIHFMTTHTYSSSGGNVMKVGETAKMQVQDVTFNVTVKAVHDKAPEGRTVDVFLKD